MTFLAEITYWRDSNDYAIQYRIASEERKNAYWLTGRNFEPIPYGFDHKFCRFTVHNGATKNDELNFWVCGECKLPRPYLWPLFIVECDECEENFFIKRYPIVYHLCENCGG